MTNSGQKISASQTHPTYRQAFENDVRREIGTTRSKGEIVAAAALLSFSALSPDQEMQDAANNLLKMNRDDARLRNARVAREAPRARREPSPETTVSDGASVTSSRAPSLMSNDYPTGVSTFTPSDLGAADAQWYDQADAGLYNTRSPTHTQAAASPNQPAGNINVAAAVPLAMPQPTGRLKGKARKKAAAAPAPTPPAIVAPASSRSRGPGIDYTLDEEQKILAAFAKHDHPWVSRDEIMAELEAGGITRTWEAVSKKRRRLTET